MISSSQISQRNNTFVANIIKEGKETIVFDVKTKKQLHKLKISKKSAVDSKFTGITFSWKDAYLAAATNTGDLHILNIKNGTVEVKQKHHYGYIRCVVFSKIQDIVYTSGEDGTIRSYDLTLQKQKTVLSLSSSANLRGNNKHSSQEGFSKKADAGTITSCLNKDSEAHLIDVNGKDTRLILAVKSNILCYSLVDNKFLSSYEGHANNIIKLKYMEYTIDQKKEIDDIKKEFFMSISDGENNSNIWKASSKEEGKIITSPFKILELTDKKECLSIQMKQIAGQYYFATIVTTHSVWGYVCNLKSKLKDMSMLKKCDFKVSIDKALIKRNLFIVCANIINESDIVILNGNAQILHTHSFTYLNEEGKCPGTELKIEYEEKAEKTNGDHKNIDTKILGLEYDQIQSKHQKSSNAVLDGIEIDKIQDKVGAILKDTSKTALKTGSLVAVLEQSLHANDIETINWVISNTDLHIISETIRKVNKDTLHQLMQNILIKLQQGVQKSSLLWLSTVLKIRWIDVLKFVNKKSTIHSHQSISTLLSYSFDKILNYKLFNYS